MCLYTIIYFLYVLEYLQWSSFALCFLQYRTQTTKGIWMEREGGIEPCTLVMDLEGTDGRERGEVMLFLHSKNKFYALTLVVP